MAGDQKHIDAVLFDLDDTLIDWAEPAVTREEYYRPRFVAMREYLAANGHQAPAADTFFEIIDQAILETWADAKKSWTICSFDDLLRRMLGELGLEVDRIDINELLRIFDWGRRPGVELFPDTIPVLNEIRRRHYKIGLLTNSFLPMWMRDAELRAYGLLAYLDARVTAADVGYVKPHPIIYRELLTRLHTVPERAVFVGDRPSNDILGANKTGLISILIDPPHLSRNLEDVVPDYTINRLSELLPILEMLEVQRTIEHGSP